MTHKIITLVYADDGIHRDLLLNVLYCKDLFDSIQPKKNLSSNLFTEERLMKSIHQIDQKFIGSVFDVEDVGVFEKVVWIQ